MSWRAEVLCSGVAEGDVLRLDAPISFWGGVDPRSARITLAGHPQCGQCISGKILVIPALIGSSSSSAILLELLHSGNAPLALILGGRDAILPVAVIVARQMGWATIPVLVLPDPPFVTAVRIVISLSGQIDRV